MSLFQISFKFGKRIATIRGKLLKQKCSTREMLPIFQEVCNQTIDVSISNCTKKISCKAGCGACCKQLVPVSHSEAENLRRLVNKMPSGRKRLIKERFKLAYAKIAEANLVQEIDKVTLRSRISTTQRVGFKYFYLNIDCPFLENGSCSIYKDRPLACREYLVTSPAKYCETPDCGKIDLVPIAASLSNSLFILDSSSGKTGKWEILTLIFNTPKHSSINRIRDTKAFLRKVIRHFSAEVITPDFKD